MGVSPEPITPSQAGRLVTDRMHPGPTFGKARPLRPYKSTQGSPDTCHRAPGAGGEIWWPGSEKRLGWLLLPFRAWRPVPPGRRRMVGLRGDEAFVATEAVPQLARDAICGVEGKGGVRPSPTRVARMREKQPRQSRVSVAPADDAASDLSAGLPGARRACRSARRPTSRPRAARPGSRR